MENYTEQEGREVKEMTLPVQAVLYLNDARKWVMFLTVLGFICVGLLVLIALIASLAASTFSSKLGMPFPAWGLGLFYLIFAGIYFIPIYYLYQFAKNAKAAIFENKSELFTPAFKYFKSHYKFMGILAIVILSLYLLVFVIAMIGAGMSAGSLL
jgi:hypothetical protein